MYVEAGEPHHRPHFHAYYQEHAAVFAIDTIECLGGGLPKAQQRLVEAWVEIHRPELAQDWALLQSVRPPAKIDPLRKCPPCLSPERVSNSRGPPASRPP